MRVNDTSFLPDNSSSECLLVNVTLTFPEVALKLVIVRVIGCFTPLYSNEPLHAYEGANTSSGTAMRRFNESDEALKAFTRRVSAQLTLWTTSEQKPHELISLKHITMLNKAMHCI